MVNSCCAFGCTNRFIKGSGLGFFRFPSESNRRKLWITALKRENWEPTEESRICGQHFQSGRAVAKPNHPDFVPSLFTFSKVETLTSFERRQRVCQKRENIQIEIEVDRNSEEMDNTSSENLNQDENDEVNQLKLQLKQAYEEINALRSEKTDLKEKLKEKDLSSSILASESKLQFYSGLQSKGMFDFVVSLLKDVKNNIKTLALETQVLIVLMKLKLNLLNTDLAYRFETSRTTVQRVLNLLIPELASSLQSFIRWPTEEALKDNMPTCFENSAYKDTVCIIDCTEVPLQRPTNMLERSKTWSNYKHTHTIKFLVGMNPSGAISFLSDCWGGRVSDKHITLKSGLIENIKPGDVVLADRGFTVSDYFAAKGANLVVPNFVKGKKQLPRQQVVRSRNISNVRIHIERVIGQLKKFHILHTVFPIRLLAHVDSITIICAALCNMSPSIVK